MSGSIKVYSAKKGISFFRYKEEFSELPKIHRSWLAITDGKGSLVFGTCISPLIDFPNTIGKLILPGAFVAEGEDPKTALRKALRKDLGVNLETEFFSEIGTPLWHKSRNTDKTYVVFCDHLYITLGVTDIPYSHSNGYSSFNTMNEIQLARFIGQRLHQRRIANSALVMNHDDGRIGVMPIMLLEAFATCNIMKRNREYVHHFDLAIDGMVVSLFGGRGGWTLDSPVTLGNKFLGFYNNSSTLQLVGNLTRATGKSIIDVN